MYEIVSVSMVIKGRLDDLEPSVKSLQEQTLPLDRIVFYHSPEPFWLDDGVVNPPKIEGVEWRSVPNIGCLRSVVNALKDFKPDDYVFMVDSDVIMEKDAIEVAKKYLDANPGCIVGCNGLKYTQFLPPEMQKHRPNDRCFKVMGDISSPKEPMGVDIIRAGFLGFKVETLLGTGIDGWNRELPCASMENEIWISGCAARAGIKRVLCGSQMVKAKRHPLSIFDYNLLAVGKKEGFIRFSMVNYFSKYWGRY